MKFIASKHIIPFALLLLIVFSFTVQTAQAMVPFNLIVLEADGLSFQVFDAKFLDFYAFGSFQESPIEKPDTYDSGVLITRYTPVDGINIQPYDQMIYYTSPDGSGGYVYYIGTTGGSSELDQKWYRGNVQAEALIKNKFESYEQDLSTGVMIALVMFAGLIALILQGAR
jgi:hypothetical protein